MPKASPTIVLVGGGHAHLGVLADWIRRGSPEARTIMLSLQRQTRYSGMIPGTLAGAGGLDTARVAGSADDYALSAAPDAVFGHDPRHPGG